jgi:hypothetical protein
LLYQPKSWFVMPAKAGIQGHPGCRFKYAAVCNPKPLLLNRLQAHVFEIPARLDSSPTPARRSARQRDGDTVLQDDNSGFD